MKIRFNNDYNHGAVPEILEALATTNNDAYAGYGLDEWCGKAKEAIAQYLDEPDAAIHFFVGGTQVNFTAITAAHSTKRASSRTLKARQTSSSSLWIRRRKPRSQKISSSKRN